MFCALHQLQRLYSTDTYGQYAMEGSFSDGDSYSLPAYDGQGSGDDFYGVRLSFLPSPVSLLQLPFLSPFLPSPQHCLCSAPPCLILGP